LVDLEPAWDAGTADEGTILVCNRTGVAEKTLWLAFLAIEATRYARLALSLARVSLRRAREALKASRLAGDVGKPALWASLASACLGVGREPTGLAENADGLPSASLVGSDAALVADTGARRVEESARIAVEASRLPRVASGFTGSALSAHTPSSVAREAADRAIRAKC
jgi:hypothetical protein